MTSDALALKFATQNVALLRAQVSATAANIHAVNRARIEDMFGPAAVKGDYSLNYMQYVRDGVGNRVEDYLSSFGYQKVRRGVYHYTLDTPDTYPPLCLRADPPIDSLPPALVNHMYLRVFDARRAAAEKAKATRLARKRGAGEAEETAPAAKFACVEEEEATSAADPYAEGGW